MLNIAHSARSTRAPAASEVYFGGVAQLGRGRQLGSGYRSSFSTRTGGQVESLFHQPYYAGSIPAPAAFSYLLRGSLMAKQRGLTTEYRVKRRKLARAISAKSCSPHKVVCDYRSPRREGYLGGALLYRGGCWLLARSHKPSYVGSIPTPGICPQEEI